MRQERVGAWRTQLLMTARGLGPGKRLIPLPGFILSGENVHAVRPIRRMRFPSRLLDGIGRVLPLCAGCFHRCERVVPAGDAAFGRSGKECSARKAVFARCGKAAAPRSWKPPWRDVEKRRSGNGSSPCWASGAVLARCGNRGCSHIGPKRQSCPAFRRDLCVPCAAGFLCHLSEVIFLAPHRAERVRDLMG